VVAAVFDRMLENPANSGGLMVVALTATAIVSNAMFLQTGHHPDPLFSTRPATTTRQATKPVVPKPNLAPDPAPALPAETPAAEAPLVMVPLPHPSPRRAAPQVAEQAAPADTDVAAQVTTDIQRELARLGLYSGAIDGKTGPRTTSAIAAYERAAGLEITGQPTAALLAAMKQPLPKPKAALDQREQERAASIAAEQQSKAEQQMHQNYRIVQSALNRMGYASLAVDGNPSADTADAIRRFELDNGLPITGDASDKLIAHMIAIGAIKPI
jgi:peptidoglycan hydrolase-like protein with peptidoglycan-binding domain